MRKLYVIMGKSGSGKDSVFKELLNKFPKLKKVLLYTSRPPRHGEEDGVDYLFKSDSEIKDLIKSGKTAEYRSYNISNNISWIYATPINLPSGNNDCITINTLDGYRLIKKYINENIEIIPIYIYCSNFNRLFRSLLREKDNPNPNCSEICRRYLSDEDDFSEDKLNNLNIRDKDKFCNDYTLEEVMEQIVLRHPELFDNN